MVTNMMDRETDRLLHDGKAAMKRGDRVMARTLLTQAVERDPHNEEAWMWLSGVVADANEQQICLENVLVINPHNGQARKGLEYISAKTGVLPRIPTLPSEQAASLDGPTGPLGSDPAAYGESPTQWSPIFHAPDGGEGSPTNADSGDSLPAWMTPPQNSAAPTPEASAERSADQTGAWPAFSPGGPVAETSRPGFDLPPAGSDFVPPWEQPGVGLGAAPSLDMSGAWSAASAETHNEPQRNREDDATHMLDASTTTSAQPVTDSSSEVPAFSLPEDVAPFKFDPESVPAFEPPTGDAPTQAAPGASISDSPAFSGSAAANGTNGDNTHQELGDWLGIGQAESAGSTPNFAASQKAPPDANAMLGWSGSKSAQGASPFGPFGGAGAPDMGPMGPYGDMQLPSPGDLPGAENGADSANGANGGNSQSQPWYLQSSSSSIAPPPTAGQPAYADPAGSHDARHGSGQEKTSAVTVTMECPNCHEQVSETSLACPECRFNFFVNCPHCHELIDTGDAKPGVIEPCPYCAKGVSKMELGLTGSKAGAGAKVDGGARPDLTAFPAMQDFATTTASATRHRSVLAWLADLLWLVVVIGMVWALTQLPTWLHLTGQY